MTPECGEDQVCAARGDVLKGLGEIKLEMAEGEKRMTAILNKGAVKMATQDIRIGTLEKVVYGVSMCALVTIVGLLIRAALTNGA